METALNETAVMATGRPGDDDLERLRVRLVDDRGNWSQMATKGGAGVSYHTLIRFANGEVKRPWGSFLKKVRAYYERLDAPRKKRRARA